jgi:uncharacterized membrane protein
MGGGYRAIGIGMWLALIHGVQCLVIIWPNQKKVLGFVAAVPEERAAAGRLAGMISRINTMLPISMLDCMVAQHKRGH